MNWMAATAASFLLFTALPARAQSPDAGSAPASTAKPADAPPASSTPATPAAAPEKKKPKKVWTNDEIGSVKGGVSVVGDGASSKTNTPSTGNALPPAPEGAVGDARQTMVENYRNQMQHYQAQIESIDKRISQLKNFKAENTSPSGGININHGYDMVPLEDQVKQLEEKKKQLQAKIDDTENEARKNGIDTGDLR
jgi:chaperonin cofactor prefoldin